MICCPEQREIVKICFYIHPVELMYNVYSIFLALSEFKHWGCKDFSSSSDYNIHVEQGLPIRIHLPPLFILKFIETVLSLKSK